jgi:hypothetical protein
MPSSLRARTWTLILVATFASVGIAQAASAQQAEEPSVGSRIRIRLPDSLRVASLAPRFILVTGTLVRATPDSLVLHVGGANPLYVSRSSITALSVSEGSSRVRSAVSNGILAGLLFGAMRLSAENSGDVDYRRVGIAAGSGAVFAALVGALSPFEHWRKIKR